MKYRIIAIITLLVTLLISCGGLPRTKKELIKYETPAEYDFRLQVGHIITVKFFYHQDLNETVKIRPDGKISLQLIDEVAAAGLTPRELDGIITQKYSGILKNPEVSVIVQDYGEQLVFVGGEVNKPGIFNVKNNITCLQAVFLSGGFRTTAEPSTVVILRNKGTDKPQFIVVDLKADLFNPLSNNDIVLQPQDIVFVPRSAVAEFDLFIEQYVNAILPFQRSIGLNYSFNYTTNIE